MPRINWRVMREDLAEKAEVLREEFRKQNISAQVTVSQYPPRVHVRASYSAELHGPRQGFIKRDTTIEADDKHRELARKTFETSKEIEKITKKNGLSFFPAESCFETADTQLFSYGFDPWKYKS